MIEGISVKNFKSIKSAETKFPKFFGAIVGKNAVGKTNLIQSINFVKNLSIGLSTTAALKKIALTPQEIYNYNDSSAEMAISITLCAEDETRYVLDLTLIPLNSDDPLPTLIVKTESLQILNNNNLHLVYKRSDASLINENGSQIPLAVEPDKLAVSQYQQPDALKVKNLFMNVFIPDQDSIDFRESIVKSDGKGLASLVVRLRQSNDGSFEQFQTITKRLLPHFSSLVEIPSSQPPGSPESENLFMILLEEENLKGKLSMKSVSAGDLRTLYVIASAMHLKSNSTFIFEEIENGLHPKRLYDLLDSLTTIARKKDMQILFTTHSAAVINQMSPRDVVYVERDTPEGTNFHLLSEGEHISQIDKALKEGVPLTDYILSRMQ